MTEHDAYFQQTLLDVVLSLSLALVFGTLFLPTSLQHLLCSLSENGSNCISFYSLILALTSKLTSSPCVVLVVAVCCLCHPKNLFID